MGVGVFHLSACPLSPSAQETTFSCCLGHGYPRPPWEGIEIFSSKRGWLHMSWEGEEQAMGIMLELAFLGLPTAVYSSYPTHCRLEL